MSADSGIYINIETGEVKDDGGNTWFLTSDSEEETIINENIEFLDGQKEAYSQVINQQDFPKKSINEKQLEVSETS